MKKGKILKNVIIYGVIVLGTVLCFSFAYRVLSWKDTSGSDLSALTQLYHTDNDLIDVLFVGSSHCYCGIYPPYFWEDYGIAAFDLSDSAQDRISALHHLKEALKTQSPKVVFVDVYGITYAKQTIVANEYRNMLSMRFSPNAVALVAEFSEKENWLDYWFRFPIIHGRYRELKKTDFETYPPNLFGRGELVSWKINTLRNGSADLPEFQPCELELAQVEWLDDLKALAEKKGFQLVFYSAPFYISAEAQAQMDAVAVYAEEAGIPMFDFNRMVQELGFDFQMDLQDPEHCNANGARKLALVFEEYLAENVTLADHRGDQKYWQWDKDLEWLYHNMTVEALEQAETPADYARALVGQKDYKVIVSLEGSDFAQSDEADYLWGLEQFGILTEEAGKWIYEDGVARKIMGCQIGAEPYYLELSNTDTLRVQYLGDYVYKENVMINQETYYNKGHRLAIIVYDELLEKVVHCGYF